MLHDPDVLLYVDAGTRYTEAEMKRLPAGTTIARLPFLNNHLAVDDIIPLRNLFFVTTAALYGDEIMIGATGQDYRMHDKSERFATLASELISYLWEPQFWTKGKQVTVQMPLKGMYKADIISAVHAKFGDAGVEKLAQSFSCYNPDYTSECGFCKPCRRKWIAFASLGYAHLVKNARPAVEKYEQWQLANGTYDRSDEERASLIQALENTKER